MADLSAFQTRSEYEEQKRYTSDLESRLADAELQIIEGEKLRKKLHNTILVTFMCSILLDDLGHLVVGSKIHFIVLMGRN